MAPIEGEREREREKCRQMKYSYRYVMVLSNLLINRLLEDSSRDSVWCLCQSLLKSINYN